MDTDSLDRADMERLAGGQDSALNDLMDRHARPIFLFLNRMLANEDDANDLAQETFVRVYQNRTSFKAGLKFTTWLYTIAGNLARNHYRWRARHPGVSIDSENQETGSKLSDTLPSAEKTPTDQALDQERADAVRVAVQDLPEDMREAIILCEWEDLAVAEAASILKTTPKAVEARLYRARNILRQSLKKWL